MTERAFESSTGPLAARLNEACQCIWVDRTKLREQLRANLGDAGVLLEVQAGLVSGSVVFLDPGEAAAMEFEDELDVVLRARFTLLVLVTSEEERALETVKAVCRRGERPAGVHADVEVRSAVGRPLRSRAEQEDVQRAVSRQRALEGLLQRSQKRKGKLVPGHVVSMLALEDWGLVYVLHSAGGGGVSKAVKGAGGRHGLPLAYRIALSARSRP